MKKKNTQSKKQVIVVPTSKKLVPKTKSAKKTKTPSIDYYNCLLTASQNNWFDPTTGKKQKITQCCKNCKLNAPSLNKRRTEEVKKLIVSYHQVGDSLKKLLQPIK